MEHIINGGVYRVDFRGNCSAVINGTHPAIVIRTIKENEVYMVLPLTSYTKERMQKVKKNGWGLHINSTNSIVLIEKYQVIHKSSIKNRWKDQNDLYLKVAPGELLDINKKFNEYVKLAGDKAHVEYQKYFEQYQDVQTNLKENKRQCSFYEIEENDSKICINFKKPSINKMSRADISELIEQNYGAKNARITANGQVLTVEIEKNGLQKS
ncbi:TPA: type II toxin-antitoxin system PemK/MazF family toxin [Bacillus cereus]